MGHTSLIYKYITGQNSFTAQLYLYQKLPYYMLRMYSYNAGVLPIVLAWRAT